MKLLKKITIVAVIATAIDVSAIAAQAHEQTKNDALMVVNAATIPLDQAAYTALSSVPGKVTKADFSNDEGKAIWEVEVVGNDKKIHDLEIDANSGAVIKNKIDVTDSKEEQED